MRLIRTLFVVLSLLCAFSAHGRDYQVISLNNGTSVRDITSVCTDDNGFVWVSNKLGVFRIAAANSKSYKIARLNQSIHLVRLLYQNQSLFAYNDKGLVFRYDELSDSFVEYANLLAFDLPSNFTLNQILCEKDGSLWVSSSLGLMKWTPNGGIHQVALPELVGANPSMCFDGDRVLLLCSDKGLIKLYRNTMSLKLVINNDSRLKSATCFCDNDARRLWIGTVSDGLLYIDEGTKELISVPNFPNKYAVSSICPVNGGKLLAGTEGAGLFYLDSRSATILYNDKNDEDNPNSIGSNIVKSISRQSDRVLIATSSEGLFYYMDWEPIITLDSHRPYDHNSISNNRVNGLCEDSKGRLFVASDNGVDVYSRAGIRLVHLCKDIICCCAMVDSRSKLWVGTHGEGFFVFNTLDFTPLEHYVQSPSVDGGDCSFIHSFVEDKDGDIWIFGNNQSIFHNVREGYYADYPSINAQRASLLPDGRICIAGDQGLMTIDKSKGELEILAQGAFLDLCVDSTGIWLASSGMGLAHYDIEQGSLSCLTYADGLNTHFINSVQKDGNLIWAGTEMGMNTYDVISGKIESYRAFPLLARSNFNQGARMIRSDGTHLYGTSKGLIKFCPDQLNRPIEKASIYVQDIRSSGSSVRDFDPNAKGVAINSLQTVSLKWKRNNFTIDLLQASNVGENLSFMWMLDGSDESWTPPTMTNSCRYSNLKVGSNLLHIRLVDSTGQHVYDSREIDFVVQAPIWRRWWFIAFVIALIIFFLANLWNYFEAKIKSRVLPIINISNASESSYVRNKNYDDPFVKKAIDVVNANMQNPIFDKEIFAQEMNVSSSALYKKLKALTDQSPLEFIKTIRMTKALKLLQGHNLTITEISELCGYSSPSYFSTAFKAFYGKSPTEI